MSSFEVVIRIDWRTVTEFQIDGVLEWDDTSFRVKRRSGEVLFETETRLAYRNIDVLELYLDNDISLDTPAGKLSLEKKNRPAAIALRSLIEAGLAADGRFRRKVGIEARVGLRRGLKTALGCAAPLVLYELWASMVANPPTGGTRDLIYLLLTLPVLGLLAGVLMVGHGLQQLWMIRRLRPGRG